MDQSKYIYIMISQTHTRFAAALRRVGKIRYNHAAIALDPRLDDLYGFARPNYRAPLLARLGRESVCRYTLGREQFVDVAILRLEVTPEQYDWVKRTIQDILEDEDYLYNLFSVLTYPLIRGFCTYKSFTCIEFVMYLLQGLGKELSKPLYRYKPGDLLAMFPEQLYFQGNLLDYRAEEADPDFFAPVTLHTMWTSMTILARLLFRLVCRPHQYERPLTAPAASK